jgi:hypothetical protein
MIEDHQKTKTTAKEIARLEKARKLAENLREKIDASENGVDMERKKNWEWTIEQNEGWEKREALKLEKSKFEFDGMSTLPSLRMLLLLFRIANRRQSFLERRPSMCRPTKVYS